MPNPVQLPSEAIGAEFTDDRLRSLGDVIARARRDKLTKREAPDTSWNLSCDCYAWAWHALDEASQGPLRDWLYVAGSHGSLDRMFYVGGPGGTPVKFYNADSPGQPLRTSRPSPAERIDPNQDDLFIERAEVATAVDANAEPISTVIRIAMHMRPDLSAGSASLQRLNEDGEIMYEWPISLEPSGILPLGSAARADGVELPEPSVELTEDLRDREEAKKQIPDQRDSSKGA